ncbi:uncharacterized protein LOC134783733 [Penaeus indicus]|uniref:uncharacterized protein LOC134783733 n=1 Tax=Penaeus indicus TaxID=29960 RepID=UPI00300CDC30
MSSLHLQTALDPKDDDFLRLYRTVPRGSSRSLITPSFMEALSDMDESMLKSPRVERENPLADFAISVRLFNESLVSDQCISKEDIMKRAKEFSPSLNKKMKAIEDHFGRAGELEEAMATINTSFEKYMSGEFEVIGPRDYEEKLMVRKGKDGWKQTSKS